MYVDDMLSDVYMIDNTAVIYRMIKINKLGENELFISKMKKIHINIYRILLLRYNNIKQMFINGK